MYVPPCSTNDLVNPPLIHYPSSTDAQIFLTIDIVALVIQAAGGGIASGSAPKLGAHIMLVGIVVQLGKHPMQTH